MNQFVTFYSWVPSFMENIDNIPFSFDRNVSKQIAKLGISYTENSWAKGITLSNNIFENDGTTLQTEVTNIQYLTKAGKYQTLPVKILDNNGLIGVLTLKDQVLPEGEDIQTFCKFKLNRDIYGNYKHFEIRKVASVKLPNNELLENDPNSAKYPEASYPIYGLYLPVKTESFISKIIQMREMFQEKQTNLNSYIQVRRKGERMKQPLIQERRINLLKMNIKLISPNIIIEIKKVMNTQTGKIIK